MAKVANLLTRIYLDEFDFSGVTHTTSMSIEPQLAVVTSFSDSGPRRVMGSYDHSSDFLGYFEPTANLQDAQLHALTTDSADHYLLHLWGDNTRGAIAYEQIVHVSSKPLSASIGEAVLLDAEFVGAGALSRGVLLTDGEDTNTSTGNLTSVDCGTTSTSQTLQAVFRVLALTGSNVTLNVQQSSDNGSSDAFATISGMTSGSLSAIGVVRTTTSAATERYKRINVAGTFDSATFIVSLGVIAE